MRFGLILRDMLLGGRHAGNTTGVAELMSRMQHAPASLRTVDSAIPEPVDALVTRCLQPDPADRYQTSADLLKDLERVATGGPAVAPPPRPWHKRVSRVQMVGAAAVVVLLGVGAYAIYPRLTAPTTSPAAPAGIVSLAVLPFRNATGDPALNSLGTSLSEVLATDLGEAQQIRMIPPQRMQEVMSDLRIDPTDSHSPAELRRIANFASASSILWGQYVKFGDEIRIDAQLQDLEQRSSPQPIKASAANASQLMDAVEQLKASIQQVLAQGSEAVLKQLQSTAWRPTTSSVEALKAYNEGVQLSRQGNHQAALARFEAATQEDPNFALANSALAQTYQALGSDAQAAQFSRRALTMSESMPAGQERYLIAAAHYTIANDTDKAIETYEQLLRVAPLNAALHFDLARIYEQTVPSTRLRSTSRRPWSSIRNIWPARPPWGGFTSGEETLRPRCRP